MNPDFAAYATNCGAYGLKVTRKEDIEEAMQKLFSHDGPGLLEITTDVKLI